jgi:hypothetical protein
MRVGQVKVDDTKGVQSRVDTSTTKILLRILTTVPALGRRLPHRSDRDGRVRLAVPH